MRMISFDNGFTFIDAKEAVDRLYSGKETCIDFDTIALYMEENARCEALNRADYPEECDNKTKDVIFLETYLSLADEDLIIG